MIRLVPDQSQQIRRAAEVEFTFDGVPVRAHVGDTIAVALMRAGQLYLRDAPRDDAPRGAFCCMGLCQECVVRIDGGLVESCCEVVRDGLVVQSLKASVP
jgi:predicted molibdopterin-dependent oxidoreductase YjgC